MTEAHLPMYESGLCCLSIPSNIPTEPLPDMGERIICGINSLGIERRLAKGDINEHNTLSAPDDLSIFMARMRAMRAGAIPRAVPKPLRAPSRNRENTSRPLNAP